MLTLPIPKRNEPTASVFAAAERRRRYSVRQVETTATANILNPNQLAQSGCSNNVKGLGLSITFGGEAAHHQDDAAEDKSARSSLNPKGSSTKAFEMLRKRRHSAPFPNYRPDVGHGGAPDGNEDSEEDEHPIYSPNMKGIIAGAHHHNGPYLQIPSKDKDSLASPVPSDDTCTTAATSQCPTASGRSVTAVRLNAPSAGEDSDCSSTSIPKSTGSGGFGSDPSGGGSGQGLTRGENMIPNGMGVGHSRALSDCSGDSFGGMRPRPCLVLPMHPLEVGNGSMERLTAGERASIDSSRTLTAAGASSLMTLSCSLEGLGFLSPMPALDEEEEEAEEYHVPSSTKDCCCTEDEPGEEIEPDDVSNSFGKSRALSVDESESSNQLHLSRQYSIVSSAMDEGGRGSLELPFESSLSSGTLGGASWLPIASRKHSALDDSDLLRQTSTASMKSSRSRTSRERKYSCSAAEAYGEGRQLFSSGSSSLQEILNGGDSDGELNGKINDLSSGDLQQKYLGNDGDNDTTSAVPMDGLLDPVTAIFGPFPVPEVCQVESFDDFYCWGELLDQGAEGWVCTCWPLQQNASGDGTTLSGLGPLANSANRMAVKVVPLEAWGLTTAMSPEQFSAAIPDFNHSHIAAHHALFEEPNHLCLLMELVKGPCLLDYLVSHGSKHPNRNGRIPSTRSPDVAVSQRLSDRSSNCMLSGSETLNRNGAPECSGGALTEDACREIMKQLFEALDSLHNRGILHRDIKLENVMLRSYPEQALDEQKALLGAAAELEGQAAADAAAAAYAALAEETASRPFDVALVDFGCACYKQDVKTTQLNGTCAYMAPELFTLPYEYDEKVDVWAAGVVLCALLTGYASAFEMEATPLPSFLTGGLSSRRAARPAGIFAPSPCRSGFGTPSLAVGFGGGFGCGGINTPSMALNTPSFARVTQTLDGTRRNLFVAGGSTTTMRVATPAMCLQRAPFGNLGGGHFTHSPPESPSKNSVGSGEKDSRLGGVESAAAAAAAFANANGGANSCHSESLRKHFAGPRVPPTVAEEDALDSQAYHPLHAHQSDGLDVHRVAGALQHLSLSPTPSVSTESTFSGSSMSSASRGSACTMIKFCPPLEQINETDEVNSTYRSLPLQMPPPVRIAITVSSDANSESQQTHTLSGAAGKRVGPFQEMETTPEPIDGSAAAQTLASARKGFKAGRFLTNLSQNLSEDDLSPQKSEITDTVMESESFHSVCGCGSLKSFGTPEPIAEEEQLEGDDEGVQSSVGDSKLFTDQSDQSHLRPKLPSPPVVEITLGDTGVPKLCLNVSTPKQITSRPSCAPLGIPPVVVGGYNPSPRKRYAPLGLDLTGRHGTGNMTTTCAGGIRSGVSTPRPAFMASQAAAMLTPCSSKDILLRPQQLPMVRHMEAPSPAQVNCQSVKMIRLQGQEWSHVDPQAAAFVRWLLTVDKKHRPSAKEALTHPWITRGSRNSNNVSSCTSASNPIRLRDSTVTTPSS